MPKLVEQNFYPEVAEKFKKYLKSYLPNNFEIFYSCDSSLRSLIRELEEHFQCYTTFSNSYIPNLQLDILLGVKSISNEKEYHKAVCIFFCFDEG